MPGLSLRTYLALECPVCLRHIDFSQQAKDAADIALFGVSDPYSVCPQCLQIVRSPSLLNDVEYRRKVRVHLHEHRGTTLKE
jgi:hypothetical protein